jgi:hypothetical protein
MNYQKYEFCKAVRCECFVPENKKYGITQSCAFNRIEDCIYTAEEFYDWLKENDYVIKKALSRSAV